MKDDELLERLREVVHEEDPLRDPALIALLDNKATDAQRADLEGRARSSPEWRAILDAYRPLDGAARERILNRVSEPKRRTMGTFIPTLAILTALPLGSYGFLVTRTIPDGWQCALSMDGELPTRGDGPQPDVVKLGPGSRFTLTLAPSADVDVSIETRAFLVKDGSARRWEVPIEMKDQRPARITGLKEQLFQGFPPGRWDVVVAVGRPYTLPSESTVAALSRDHYRTDSRSYRLYAKPLELRDTPEP